MNIRKTALKYDDDSSQANKGRRSFLWKAGAGLSAILAAAVPGVAGAGINNEKNLKTKVDRLSEQVGILKDENTIRLLHQTYEGFLDKGMYEEVVDLFTDDSEVLYNGGIFKGKTKGISRLFRQKFRSGLTGKRIDHAPGILPDIEKEADKIEVSPDGKTARARFPYSMQAGTPVVDDSSIVEMARQVGGGIRKWWEGGTCEISCVKNTGDGSWKIKRIEYSAVSKTDYRPGKPYSMPVSIPLFSKVYPADPDGPDELMVSALKSMKA